MPASGLSIYSGPSALVSLYWVVVGTRPNDLAFVLSGDGITSPVSDPSLSPCDHDVPFI